MATTFGTANFWSQQLLCFIRWQLFYVSMYICSLSIISPFFGMLWKSISSREVHFCFRVYIFSWLLTPVIHQKGFPFLGIEIVLRLSNPYIPVERQLLDFNFHLPNWICHGDNTQEVVNNPWWYQTLKMNTSWNESLIDRLNYYYSPGPSFSKED